IGADGNADGLPTVLLEAMATVIPCVAASVTAVGEVVRDGRTGWLVPTGDTAALISAVREALHPGTDRSALTAAARVLLAAASDSAAQARRLRTPAERSGHRHIPTPPIELPAQPLAPSAAAPAAPAVPAATAVTRATRPAAPAGPARA